MRGERERGSGGEGGEGVRERVRGRGREGMRRVSEEEKE